MKPSPLWKAALLLLASLPTGPAAFAGPKEVEIRMTLQAHGTGGAPASPRDIDRTVEVLRSRLDQADASDAVVEANGDRISLRAGGIEEPGRIRRLLLSQADLAFRFVRFPESGGAGSREEVLANFGGSLPPDLELLEEGGRSLYYAVEKDPIAGGEDIENARPSLGQFGEPILEFRLTPEAAQVFGEKTGANVGKALAIVLNGKVLSAPVIRARITDTGVIEGGGFTKENVQDLATVLRSGALPGPLTVLQESQGPSPVSRSTRSALFIVLGFAVFVAAGLLYSRWQQKRPASTVPPA